MATNSQFATSHPKRSKNLPPDARVAVICLIGSILLSSMATVALFFASASSTQAASHSAFRPQASCDTSPPCKGLVIWPNAIWGAQSEFQTQNLVGVVGAGISNSLTLDDLNHGCGRYTDSWFAAGYATHNIPWYFWEECRPSSVDIVHYVYQVPANNYGFYWYYRMYRYDSTTYQIDFFYDNWTWYWSGTSYNNTMLATEIDLGELAGSRTDSSDTALYRNNQWEDNVNGSWHWQNSNGTITNTNPPSFGWNQRPSDYPNTGGLGNTCWC